MISRLSVKDSQFVKANTLSAETRVPVLDDGVNKTASARLMAKWIAKNINLEEIPITLNGVESDDLFNALAEILSYAKYGGGGGGGFTTDIGCGQGGITFFNTLYTGLHDLLLQIVSRLQEHETKLTSLLDYASQSDIATILNSNN
jgi:hypothetical protein